MSDIRRLFIPTHFFALSSWHNCRKSKLLSSKACLIFPKVAKCKFHKHGMGGGIQSHDALCVLPLNHVNEKIYLFLWIMLIPLVILSGLAVLYRFLLLTCPWLRFYAMKKPSPKIEKVFKRLVWKLVYSDWFILHLMFKNVAEDLFDILMEELVTEDEFTSLSKIC